MQLKKLNCPSSVWVWCVEADMKGQTPRSITVFAWSGFRAYWAFIQSRWLPDNSCWNTRLWAQWSHTCEFASQKNRWNFNLYLSDVFYCSGFKNKRIKEKCYDRMSRVKRIIRAVQINLIPTILVLKKLGLSENLLIHTHKNTHAYHKLSNHLFLFMLLLLSV